MQWTCQYVAKIADGKTDSQKTEVNGGNSQKTNNLAVRTVVGMSREGAENECRIRRMKQEVSSGDQRVDNFLTLGRMERSQSVSLAGPR